MSSYKRAAKRAHDAQLQAAKHFTPLYSADRSTRSDTVITPKRVRVALVDTPTSQKPSSMYNLNNAESGGLGSVPEESNTSTETPPHPEKSTRV